jgi:hypothetical protein
MEEKRQQSLVIPIIAIFVCLLAFGIPYLFLGVEDTHADVVLVPRFTATPTPLDRILTQQAFAALFFSPTPPQILAEVPTSTESLVILITGPTLTFTPTITPTVTTSRTPTPTHTLIAVFPTRTQSGGVASATSTPTNPRPTSTPIVIATITSTAEETESPTETPVPEPTDPPPTDPPPTDPPPTDPPPTDPPPTDPPGGNNNPANTTGLILLFFLPIAGLFPIFIFGKPTA